MKRTIVCTLLALSISSSLYSPQIVLAAEQTEETLTEHSNTGATDTIQNTKSATAPQEDTLLRQRKLLRQRSKPQSVSQSMRT